MNCSASAETAGPFCGERGVAGRKNARAQPPKAMWQFQNIHGQPRLRGFGWTRLGPKRWRSEEQTYDLELGIGFPRALSCGSRQWIGLSLRFPSVQQFSVRQAGGLPCGSK
jgi:hypothetical protein